MKTGIILLLTLLTATLLGGGTENNNNLSASYVRTATRNAATSGTDIAVYNPAGIAQLKDGIYVGFDNQFILKDYAHTLNVNDTTYRSDVPTLLLPYGSVIAKFGQFAGYLAFSVAAGGGSLEFDDGIYAIAIDENMQPLLPGKPSVEAFSAHYSTTLGGVYQINEMISLSAAFRVVYAQSSQKITTSIPETATHRDQESSALGFGSVFGVNLKPIKPLTIALTFKQEVNLEFEIDKDLNEEIEGTKSNRDLPAILSLGIAYQVIEPLTIEFNFNYYLDTMADWDGAEDSHDDSFELALSGEYQIIPMVAVSLGFLYTNTGANSSNYNAFKPALDAYSIAGGAKITPLENIAINAGLMKMFYLDDELNVAEGVKLDLEKDVWIIAIGAEYRF